MKIAVTSLLLLGFVFTNQAQTDQPLPKEVQIKMAAQVAPEKDRANVTVYGYDQNGEFTLLQEGSNNLICLADNPNDKGIHISCYSTKLEPFMKRGRTLREEGKNASEVRDMREKEAEEGTLKMPDAPSMLYVLDGEEENLNKETGELKNGNLRYVVYTPNATTESTGLPDAPFAPGMPWLMDPGTYRAHIMITPPQETAEKMDGDH